MVNFDTQYTNINHLSNNMNNKKLYLKMKILILIP